MKRAWFLAFICISALLIGIYADDLVSRLRMPDSINWYGLIATIAAQCLFWMSLSLVWVTMLREITSTRIGLWPGFCQQAMVSLGKYFPGKVWGMIARGGQMRLNGMDLGAITKVSYLEQLFLLHSGVVLSGLLALAVYDSGPMRLLAMLAVLSAPVAAYLHERILRAFFNVVAKFWRTKGRDEVARITTAGYLRYLAGYGMVWLFSGLVFAGLYFAFVDQVLTAKLLAVLLLANATGIWMGFVAVFAPGGIGVREATSIAVMLPFVPLENAVMVSLLSRVWLLFMDLLSGLMAVWSPKSGNEAT